MEEDTPEIKKRPGGPLKAKPFFINGEFYDPLDPPKLIRDEDGKQKYIGGRKLDKDEIYAQRFWDGDQPDGTREQMTEAIQQAAKIGTLSSPVNTTELTDHDREKLSAYRILAKELGFEVGQFSKPSGSSLASATIAKTK